MKKAMAICLFAVLIISIVSCQSNDDKRNGLITHRQVGKLVSEKGYTGENFNDSLINRHRDELVNAWGEPDGHLSGFYGDVWNLKNTNDEYIVLYYDGEGYVRHIIAGGKGGSK